MTLPSWESLGQDMGQPGRTSVWLPDLWSAIALHSWHCALGPCAFSTCTGVLRRLWHGHSHPLHVTAQPLWHFYTWRGPCGRGMPLLQDRTGQDRTGQDRTGQDRTGQDRTGQDRTGQDRTGQLLLGAPAADTCGTAATPAARARPPSPPRPPCRAPAARSPRAAPPAS